MRAPGLLRSASVVYQHRRQFRWLLLEERKKWVDLPWAIRCRMWRHGFLSCSWNWYSFARKDFREYLSDYARFVRTPLINKTYGILLDNKLLFYETLSRHERLLPARHCLLLPGRVCNLSSGTPVKRHDDVLGLLDTHGRLVVKPVFGGGGVGVHVLSSVDGYRDNGRQVSRSDLAQLVARLNHHIVTEFVEQHPFAAGFLSSSTNTMRILTVWDYARDEPMIAAAVHRFGASPETVVDNFGQGGISVAIDADTGVLGRGVQVQPDWTPRWHDRHPVTGEVFVGRPIPGWHRIREKTLALATELSYLPYIAWDVVQTDDGFRIIEGNNFSSVDLLQIHRPLLADPRVARFYRAHSVIA